MAADEINVCKNETNTGEERMADGVKMPDNGGGLITGERPATDLTVHDFDYELPPELIAQAPSAQRDGCRLLRVGRKDGELSHHIFSEVEDMLEEGDVLVINDSKVIPARIYGKKEGGSADCEILLLRQKELDTWEVLVRPGKRLKKGSAVICGDGLLRAEIIDETGDGDRIVHFTYSGDNLYSVLDRIGQMPLPPYITSKVADQSRYQTVYAREAGSAAAPTAGLHFTNELLERIEKKGVKIARVMLHVGLGTFRPVKEERIADHEMHTEFFSITQETADLINSRRGRLIAVGTTSCRVLESVADENGVIRPFTGDTGIFIYPGYRFKAIDGLITNFHLPQSTLLMLVSAFSSREIMRKAYEEAIREEYQFFSFGDAMIIC